MALTTTSGYEVSYPSDLDYLIGPLRAHLGDVQSPFTFSDALLRRTLVDAVKALSHRWQFRYKISAAGTIGELNYTASGIDYNYYSVSRNTTKYTFIDTEPPVIQISDERAIILQASIIIKSGNLHASSANSSFGSWRDDELSYSNIESGKSFQTSLSDDRLELDSLLPSRARKLARTDRQSLGGFTSSVGNYYEGSDIYGND